MPGARFMTGTAGLAALGVLAACCSASAATPSSTPRGLSYLSTEPQRRASTATSCGRSTTPGRSPRTMPWPSASTATCRTTSSASTSPRPRTVAPFEGLHAAGLHEPINDSRRKKRPDPAAELCLACHADLVHELVGGPVNGRDSGRGAVRATATPAWDMAKRRGSADRSGGLGEIGNAS